MMNILPQTTQRRLKKIPLVPSVWEGDRRSLSGVRNTLDPDQDSNGECIIWVDGSEGLVRAMDIVSPDMGPEALVRTLLRAIEAPHSPAKPARPQKIVVRNREIQFFLRGVLQDLEIIVDYVPELPLIEDLFRSFEEMQNFRPPALPASHEPALRKTAYEIWQATPWDLLADYDIIAIEVNRWGINTLYACIMGMLGREYGVILYRSLESLKQFRQAALVEKSIERLEKAFLTQDCWFLSFETADEDEEDDDEDFDLADLPLSQIRPVFGSVHPYEGIRPYLDEEEALTVYASLQALIRFVKGHQFALSQEPIDELHKRYRLSLELTDKESESVAVTVSTLPKLAAEFLEMLEAAEMEELDDLDDDDDDDDEQQFRIALNEDLVPENAYIRVGMLPWELIEQFQIRPKIHHQTQAMATTGDGLPVLVVQTSRPKAKEIIEKIETAGGLQAICFNQLENPFTDEAYELIILQMGNGDLYLGGEFLSEDPMYQQDRHKWDQRCQKTKGYCGLIVAMGATGTSRGNPQLSDMMALFETKVLDSQELAIKVLKMPQFD